MLAKFGGRWKIGLALLMAFVMFSLPTLINAAMISDQVEQARLDAEAQAMRDNSGILWFFLGFLGGVITIAIAALITPNVPQTALLGKSPEYVATYSDAYISKAKKIRLNNALIGCGAWAVLWVVLVVVVFAATEEATDYYYW